MAEAGRPPADLDEAIRKLSEYLVLGYTFRKSCQLSGLPYTTYFPYYKDEDSDFRKKVDILINEPNTKARRVWVRAIERNDYQAAKEWLERKEKDEFSTRSELTGKDNQPLIPKPILGGQAENVPSDNSNK